MPEGKAKLIQHLKVHLSLVNPNSTISPNIIYGVGIRSGMAGLEGIIKRSSMPRRT